MYTEGRIPTVFRRARSSSPNRFVTASVGCVLWRHSLLSRRYRSHRNDIKNPDEREAATNTQEIFCLPFQNTQETKPEAQGTKGFKDPHITRVLLRTPQCHRRAHASGTPPREKNNYLSSVRVEPSIVLFDRVFGVCVLL